MPENTHFADAKIPYEKACECKVEVTMASYELPAALLVDDSIRVRPSGLKLVAG